MPSNDLTIDDVRERLADVRTAMVTSIDEAGTLSSRPVTLLDIDANGDPWFLVDAESSWVTPVDNGPVNVAVSLDDLWVSFAGRASIVRDASRIDELSNQITDAFFDRDAEQVALRVATEQIEWWASDGTVSTALDTVKAVVAGQPVDTGSSGTIDAR